MNGLPACDDSVRARIEMQLQTPSPLLRRTVLYGKCIVLENRDIQLPPEPANTETPCSMPSITSYVFPR